jgi:hypothetical protein
VGPVVPGGSRGARCSALLRGSSPGIESFEIPLVAVGMRSIISALSCLLPWRFLRADLRRWNQEKMVDGRTGRVGEWAASIGLALSPTLPAFIFSQHLKYSITNL